MKLQHVPKGRLSPETAQTPGMVRMAAISGRLTGSGVLWMGRAESAPRTESGPHHHGEAETAIYVLSGTPEFAYLEDGREVRFRTEPGDFVFVPPHVPHLESNAHSDEPAVLIVARTTQEAIAVNLDSL